MRSSTYLIHDNRSRPFKVIITDKRVDIYNSDNTDKKSIQSIECESIFIGKSPLNKMTKFSGGFGNEFDGNSILLHIDNLNYIYIGCEIYLFKAFSKIVEYVSPVGNNDVPYPYAIDDCKNIYLLLEHVVLANNIKLNILREKEPELDVYNYFYNARLLTDDMGIFPPKKSEQIYRNINKFILGDEIYTLTYTPQPNEEYDRLISEFGKMYIIDTLSHRIEYTKEMYIELMNSFGESKSFKPIDSLIIMNERL